MLQRKRTLVSSVCRTDPGAGEGEATMELTRQTALPGVGGEEAERKEPHYPELLPQLE